jgi:hypothetical protein
MINCSQNLPLFGKTYRSFTWQPCQRLWAADFFCRPGYGPVSSLPLPRCWSAICFWSAFRDANRLHEGHPSKLDPTAIFFGILSTIRTIVLSHMMVTIIQSNDVPRFRFLSPFSIQRLFACFALFFDRIKSIVAESPSARFTFWAFFLSGVPAYFLSTLWARIPAWLYVLVVLAAFLQVSGWWLFVRRIWQYRIALKSAFQKKVILLFTLVALALTLKLFLQLGSTIPIVSKLAFGFRPIVIAYLHLVLLLIITVFLLSFLYLQGYIRQTRISSIALVVFVIGFLNETVLATEGYLLSTIPSSMGQ